MLSVGSISTVSSGHDLVHDVCEKSPGLFISSNETASLNHRMSGVIDTCLDAVAEVNAKLGGLALELAIDTRVFLENVSQKVVVVLEVGQLSGHGLGEESGSLLRAIVFFITTSELDPLRKSLDIGRETSRRVIRSDSGSTGAGDSWLGGGDLTFDIFLFLEHLFPADEVGNSLNENVYESSFRFT